jgi:hypothetical protein
MIKINFQELKVYGQKSGKCGCGKRRARSITLYQTLNPFNRNKKGEIKTREEIYEELKVDLESWKKEPITCKDCEE